MKYLPLIHDYADFRNLPVEGYPDLATEIRAFLTNLAAQKEIHFSGNLGVVEVTIALLHTFDLTKDWVVWDTGHQTYVQKILTGRAQALKRIRTFGGPAGLMDREESVYDHYSPGHSGNALSVLMGLLAAPRRYNVVVIGDGSFVNGITLEALNDLGARQLPVIIILNDNGMSISEGVGAFKAWTQQIPHGQTDLTMQKFFAALGITYLGVVDGHDIPRLNAAFTAAQELVQTHPVLVHIRTVKGKGCPDAEADRIGAYHASPRPEKLQFGTVAAEYLTKLRAVDPTVWILNPAMNFGTKFTPLMGSHHYVDTGITEEHTISYASGLALAGMNVYVVIYATFLQRGYDQLLHDCARLGLKITFLVDRAGMSGGDGPSHHGIFDVGFVKSIPGTIITSPRNPAELVWLLNAANQSAGGLWFIRYPKSPFTATSLPLKPHLLHHWEWLIQSHHRLCIITYGPYTDVIVAAILEQHLPCDVVNACFVTGYELEELHRLFHRYSTIICYERIWGEQGLSHDLLAYANRHRKRTRIIPLHYQNFHLRGETKRIDLADHMDVSDVIKLVKELATNE